MLHGEASWLPAEALKEVTGGEGMVKHGMWMGGQGGDGKHGAFGSKFRAKIIN